MSERPGPNFSFSTPSTKARSAALRTGFAKATAPFVIVQDADLEYDPADYAAAWCDPASGKDGARTWCLVPRFAAPKAHRVLYFWHYVGNKGLTLLSNMATNLNLTDMETGYKMFRREVIQKIPN